MKKEQVTRHNHYVPIWYQKGFLIGRRTTLFYLDRDPQKTELPNGRVIVGEELQRFSPKKCFRGKDLYTTRFGNLLNDDIEKYLFGAIDSKGAVAVRAFADNDQRAIHENFQEFFEFLDAQKLRTPKGLDWIKCLYPNLTQLDLMLEMQHLRQMHCTMWCECVREIVSAKHSDVKFIVTDHPVTIYNVASPPTAAGASYIDDPSIALNGSQTVFPLDADHCLILTNLEYAQDSSGVDPSAQRQNVRFSGQTITRTDALIRDRFLAREEVIAINSLLKARSTRFIAAYEEKWLYPEGANSFSWEDIGKVLLPPSDELWHFGGEIYIGHKDGSTQYQDAFGRTDGSHKYLRKKSQVEAPERNDLCGCGSGRKYKRCCQGVSKEDRPPWDVYSIRDRNQILCNAITDILDLNKEATWEDVRRNLSNDQVKRIHEFVEMLWPRDTNLADLLPRPDSRVFRTVYMGLIDPRTITASVISSLAYFDEIIVVNPFPNPSYMTPEFSPTESPGQHKSQMLKNVSVMLTLMPFIDAGTVHVVPDPMDFNAEFRRSLISTIENRTANWKPTEEETRRGMALAKDDYERDHLRLPDDALRAMIRDSQPDISPELIENTIQYIKEKLANDPFALLQPMQAGKDNGELRMLRGMSLEFALFLAYLTGSAIYTDDPAMWRQLHEFATTDKDLHSSLPVFTEEFKNTEFTVELNPDIALEIRGAGKFLRMRRVFRKLFRAALSFSNDAQSAEKEEKLARNLKEASSKANTEWQECSTKTGPTMRLRQRMELSAPATGFSMNSIYRLLITFGRRNFIKSVPIGLFLTLEETDEDSSAQP